MDISMSCCIGIYRREEKDKERHGCIEYREAAEFNGGEGMERDAE
jgi:hypothetical protein